LIRAIKNIIDTNNGRATKKKIMDELVSSIEGKKKAEEADKICKCLYRNFEREKSKYAVREGTTIVGDRVVDRIIKIINENGESTMETIKKKYRDVFPGECSNEYWESSIYKALSSSQCFIKGNEDSYYYLKKESL